MRLKNKNGFGIGNRDRNNQINMFKFVILLYGHRCEFYKIKRYKNIVYKNKLNIFVNCKKYSKKDYYKILITYSNTH